MEGIEIFSRGVIESRVRELASEIDRFYGDEPIVAVCVLKGAFLFFSDLVRAMRNDVTVDFVRLSSYEDRTESSGVFRLLKDTEASLVGRHVLIVEDIIDSGRSMEYLSKLFLGRGAKSVRFAALLDKKERRVVPLVADFVGFDLPRGFVVGYGMDYAEKYRTLPGIWILQDA